MKIIKQIGAYFSNTQEMRSKTKNLIYMIGLYYTFSFFLMLGCRKLNIGKGISTVIVEVLTLVLLFAVYKLVLEEFYFFRFEKRKMALKTFLIFLVITTIKGAVTISVIDIIYTIKGIENPILPGTVQDIGTSPATLLCAIIIGPIIEELIFREAGLTLFTNKDNKLEAIILTSLTFGLMHSNLPQALNATIGGLIYGYIAVEYGVRYSILLHIINNATVYIEYFLNLEVFMYVVSLIGIVFIVIAFGKTFFKKLKEYSKENTEYSFKRQMVYFSDISLILFIAIWSISIILSV